MEEAPLISVIVPVFNKEAYLPGCLDSILGQSFSSLELILVDDFSKDGCPDICARYAQADARIKYYRHETNMGQQAALVDGFRHASGSWIAFVDSDDKLPKDSLKMLYEHADEKTDIVVGFSWQGDNSVTTVPIEEWRVKMLRSDTVLCTRWAKLYRRTVLEGGTMEGYSSLKLGEDMIHNIKASFLTDNPVIVMQTQVYDYNQNDSSYSVHYQWTAQKCMDIIQAVQDAIPASFRQERCYTEAVISNALGMLHKIILRGSRSEQRALAESAYVSWIRKAIEEGDYPLSPEERLMVEQPGTVLTRFRIRASRGLLLLRKKMHLG